MILMISSHGDTLESQPNPRFGRTPIFILYNLDDDTWQSLKNPAITAQGGAGVAASQFLIDHGTQVAISGRFGPNAHQALNAAGIEMLTFDDSLETIQSVIEAYKSGDLFAKKT